MYQYANTDDISLKAQQLPNTLPPLLLLLSFVTSATVIPSETVLQLSYQARGISFTDWISLFTLCLTPLILHVIAGTP